MPRSGQSICSTRPALGDRLVLVPHRLGDREEVGLVVLVVVVAEEQRDDAGRGRAHEASAAPLHRRSRPCRLSTSICAALAVAHAIGRVAGGRLAARAAGIAEHALRQPRELGEVLVDEGVAGAAEAVEPVLDVGGVARLRHLAVVDDVDAGLDLLAARPRPRPRARARRAPRASTGTPSSFAYIMRIRSSGRGRLPVWVVRKRSVLRFMGAMGRPP